MKALTKSGVTLLIFAACLWPLWLFLGAHALFQPHGFWQQLILAGVGLYFLAGIQLVFFILALVLSFLLWND